MVYDATSMRTMFDGVADIYHSIRPGYPDALFEDLFGLLPERPSIVEVGPGTGQATRGLLGHGASVHAVELGPAMASKLRDVLPTDSLAITVGDFEHVPPASPTYDAVFSATAYHWIQPPAHLDRPAALLRHGGLIAIVDLVQVDSDADGGFFAAAQPIYERYGERHVGPPAPGRSGVDPPMRRVLLGDDRFERVTLRTYDWDKTYTAAEYRAMMRSYSGTQAMHPAAREGLLDDIEALVVERFGGQVTRPAVVALTTATFVGSADETTVA